MTNSASQATRAPFEHSLGIIRQASIEILLLLGIHTTEGKEPRWFMEQLEQARLNLGGWGAVAKKLRINDAQLSQFMLQLRHLQQHVPQYDSGQEVSENQLLAALRFVTSLEHLRQQQPLLTYQTELEEPDQEAHLEAQRQLRAIELTLKALIARAWPDRASLNHYLKQHFGPDRLRQWLKQGEDQHALEGMLFSELALMVVDKKLFARHYVRIFNDASALTLFAESRTTLRMFLDDCRLARNEVIARQPLTSAQLMLLNVQYQQIVRPIQRAYAEKRTRVNPASFLLADERELRQFWETARLKDRQAGGDKHEISESIEPVSGLRVRLKSVSNLFPALCGAGLASRRWRYWRARSGYLVRRRQAPITGKLPQWRRMNHRARRLPRGKRSIIWGLPGMRLPCGRR